jgi:hypothetical protein
MERVSSPEQDKETKEETPRRPAEVVKEDDTATPTPPPKEDGGMEAWRKREVWKQVENDGSGTSITVPAKAPNQKHRSSVESQCVSEASPQELGR